ncbi:uncharacterized protein EKO05_0004866 [Ascochyta rabiei]|uniref:Uncharacterized protein n=1 Tax=Didymella rabiei TaxID=5454 RepID=A0A163M4V3_DIDRA|nr:uncharacterized protein EKO05_0004866 [Ascochyta rabiei]KZM28403.1 hypothetical protein ST47_g442 [Ascochyta rabiei]UPX14380.1 hypothetical protein EKO05_0004866 [Ascochyta rabiei]
MMFSTRYIALAAIVSTLANALPFDTIKRRVLVPREKSYAVINVDGGSSTGGPADATTIVEETTKTVQVTDPGPTITAEVTATVVEPVPAPAATSTSTSCTSSSTSQSSSSRPTPTWTSTTIIPTSASPVASTSIETPKPVFVTVTITDDAGPTEYYDSGMWHTSYRIKSFEAIATTSLVSTPSSITSASTGLPAW